MREENRAWDQKEQRRVYGGEAGLMTGGCDGQIVITALMSGKMQTHSSDLTDRDSSLSG